MTQSGASFGIRAYVSHALVALKALIVVSDFQARHFGVSPVECRVATFAGRKRADNALFKLFGFNVVTFFTGK